LIFCQGLDKFNLIFLISWACFAGHFAAFRHSRGGGNPVFPSTSRLPPAQE
jgi:hypothetical protein